MTTATDAYFWDKIARKYAQDKIADEAGYERTLVRTRQLLEPEMSVLELGCGTGSSALRLGDSVRHYLATDISAEMIRIAGEKLTASSVRSLAFRNEIAESILPEGIQFDALLGFNYLHLVRDMRGTLRTIRDLLVPQGLFISKTACIGDMNPLIRYAIPLMRAVGKAPYVNVFSANELERHIHAAGFEILSVERHATRGRDTRPFIVARKS